MTHLGSRLRHGIRSLRRRRSGAEAAFSTSVRALLESSSVVALVQVGANDGLVADPVQPLVREDPERFHLLLIEPQESVIAHLRATYAQHPDATIANCAVGERGTLTLFTVRPECWADCAPDYAGGWPAYRAPTGIASGKRSHVDEWVARHYRGSRAPADVVEELVVESMPLPDVMRAHGFGDRVDVLVVDTEGLDDVVLGQSDLPGQRPAVVYYEHANLSAHRQSQLAADLVALGYSLVQDDQNTCATRPSPMSGSGLG